MMNGSSQKRRRAGAVDCLPEPGLDALAEIVGGEDLDVHLALEPARRARFADVADELARLHLDRERDRLVSELVARLVPPAGRALQRIGRRTAAFLVEMKVERPEGGRCRPWPAARGG